MNTETGTMNASQYAKHRGLSRTRVRQLRDQGRVFAGADTGLIDVARSDAALDGTLPPESDGTLTPATSLHEAQRIKEIALARKATIEVEQMGGNLVRVDELMRAWGAKLVQANNALELMVDKITMIGETPEQQVKLREITGRAVNKFREAMTGDVS